MSSPVVVLVGPPGAGKSTVGELLARVYGVSFRDTDADVEAAAGRSVADVFLEDGEETFRALERAAVVAGLAAHDGVLALGGGAVLASETQDVLAAYAAAGGTVVFLDVSLAQAAPRVGFNVSRPLLLGNPRAQWQQLMTARRPVYEKVATLRVDTDDLTPDEVAAQIIAALGVAPTPEAGTPQTAPTVEDPK